MNNTFHDTTNDIEYVIPAPRQLTRNEAELAIQIALESYGESALAHYLRRYPETPEDAKEQVKQRLIQERVAKQRGGIVLVHSQFTELAKRTK